MAPDLLKRHRIRYYLVYVIRYPGARQMTLLPAQEIKRRGISAVDEALALGPVHIVKNNQPQYVVLSESAYRELLEAQEEAAIARVRASLEDAAAGNVTSHASVEALLKHLAD
jgi:PHD/YefM family antitoxin component YafN of YafNO toxin-antitoxin module